MSKRDYEKIAAAIAKVREHAHYDIEGPSMTWIIDEVAKEIAKVMSANNERFDTQKFLKAAKGQTK